MDNITHSLVGALIGQAGLKRKTGLAMPALIIGANLPDVDAACFLWLEGVEHLGFRRGITHGPPALLLLPLVLAGLLYGFDRWQAKRGTRPQGRLPVRFRWLYTLSFLACLTHPALDWLNVYGIRLLMPFSDRWFFGDTLFIIDVWLWALLGFATWLSLKREKGGGNWVRPARVALTIACGYILINGIITRDAERMRLMDAHYADTIAAPAPLQFWKRQLIFPNQQGNHALIDNYSGPGNQRLNVRRLGGVTLADCRLSQAAERDPQVRAFLVWSRVPFVEYRRDGLWLKDARFADPNIGDRFAVRLPEGTCDVFFR